jgi:hypothetical protein
LNFKNTQVDGLVKHKSDILEAVRLHGVVCIKNVDLSPKEQYELTGMLFDEVIHLPPSLAFNNQHDDYPQVARVTNVTKEGKSDKEYKTAAYWH